MASDTPSTPAALLTTREVADLLRCSERTVFTLVKTGRLKSVKLGPTARSAVRFTPDALRAFIDAAQTGGAR